MDKRGPSLFMAISKFMAISEKADLYPDTNFLAGICRGLASMKLNAPE